MMFYGKKIKAIEKRLAKAEQFEKGVCTVIDNYFATNEKKELKFSTDCVCDKFYHFVMSVDEKLKRLDKIEEENETLKAEIAKECEEHQQFCETAKKKVYDQQTEIFAKNHEIEALRFELEDKKTIINSQAKDIERLAKAKTATAKGGKK